MASVVARAYKGVCEPQRGTGPESLVWGQFKTLLENLRAHITYCTYF